MKPRNNTSHLAGEVLTIISLFHTTTAQQPGTSTPELHPQLSTSKCTTSGGCVTQDTSVVLDWGYRWLHTAEYTSCTTAAGAINATLCPDEATCAENCYIEGANYTAAGVSTSGSSLTLRQYMPSNTSQGVSGVSPRVYLLDNDSGNYVLLRLRGQELSFNVDLSTLPCGENGALYLAEMDASGGRAEYNTGGARYGAGYCDAQCPVPTFRNGTLNTASAGYCCNEMDILEANSRAAAFTPHPCADDGSNCDRGGCGLNPYSLGYPGYWAPGSGAVVDTSKPFTVVTQFVTDDETTTGTLSQIRRIYKQGNVTLPGAVSSTAAAPGGPDAINATWCASVDASAAEFGNLVAMGEALGRGMVLAFSIWNDNSQFMNWLDSGSNGPCSSTEGNPALIEENYPGTHVVFSNIAWGDIGSTTS